MFPRTCSKRHSASLTPCNWVRPVHWFVEFAFECVKRWGVHILAVGVATAMLLMHNQAGRALSCYAFDFVIGTAVLAGSHMFLEGDTFTPNESSVRML